MDKKMRGFLNDGGLTRAYRSDDEDVIYTLETALAAASKGLLFFSRNKRCDLPTMNILSDSLWRLDRLMRRKKSFIFENTPRNNKDLLDAAKELKGFGQRITGVSYNREAC